MNFDFFKTAKELLSHDGILIVTHKNPDGDTLCSASALCSALRRAGRTSYLFDNPQITKRYSQYTSPYIAPASFKPGYIVSVDVAAEDMYCRGFEGHTGFCIDHHATNPLFGDCNCVMPEKSSCSEIILGIIEEMNGNVTPLEAEMLYVGLSTDCGCFQYGNTNADSHTAAARLISFGAEIFPLNQKYFRKVTRERLMLERMIYNSMEFYHDSHVVVCTVTLDMLSESGAVEDDLDDIAALPGRTDSMTVGITVRELEKGLSKISVRTDGEYSANFICSAFGGGGHAMAAGCTIHESPEKAKQLILEVIDGIWR